MAKRKGRKRSLGSNVDVTVYIEGIPIPMDDIDSVEVTNNDNLMSYRPLGSTITVHDIDYGDFSIELGCGKTGSDLMRVAETIEEQHKLGVESPTGQIDITVRGRDGTAEELISYLDCVFQIRTVSHSDAGSEVTQSVTATSGERRFTQLQPPSNLQF